MENYFDEGLMAILKNMLNRDKKGFIHVTNTDEDMCFKANLGLVERLSEMMHTDVHIFSESTLELSDASKRSHQHFIYDDSSVDAIVSEMCEVLPIPYGGSPRLVMLTNKLELTDEHLGLLSRAHIIVVTTQKAPYVNKSFDSTVFNTGATTSLLTYKSR